MQVPHQTLFISHGGGPRPLLGDPGHQALNQHLVELASIVRRPKAIIVVSAHWEAPVATVTTNPQPDLLYDYYGFPPESYDITYPCAGEPALAHQIIQVLNQAGIDAAEDDKRGLDHGAFVPLNVMYPEADIPCIQLSLVNTLDAAEHIKIGQALAKIKYDDLLILGSGFSFHNMRAFSAPDTTESCRFNRDFETWLQNTLTDTSITESQRQQRLIDWQQAPAARYCHPREEHLIPLHVCYGAAGCKAEVAGSVLVLNKQASSFGWLTSAV